MSETEPQIRLLVSALTLAARIIYGTKSDSREEYVRLAIEAIEDAKELMRQVRR